MNILTKLAAGDGVPEHTNGCVGHVHALPKQNARDRQPRTMLAASNAAYFRALPRVAGSLARIAHEHLAARGRGDGAAG
jgi:hypothetical protein